MCRIGVLTISQKEKTAASSDRSRDAASRITTGGMRSVPFFLGYEPSSAAPHACDKEERADGSTIWAKIRQSFMCADMDPVTLAAADVVRRSEEM